MANNGTSHKNGKGLSSIDCDSTIEELDDALSIEDSGVHEVSAEIALLEAKQEAHEKRVKMRLVKSRRSIRRTQQLMAGEVAAALEEAAAADEADA